MRPSRRIGSLALGLASGAAYGAYIRRRNLALERPPLRSGTGERLPPRCFSFSDGESVAYVDIGPTDADGPGAHVPTLFLIPGADGVKETFRYQIPALARRHRVVCADLRTGIAAADGFDRLVRDALELLAALRCGPSIVLGQSLGGAIAMRLTCRHPERVRALALSNTFARLTYGHAGLNRTLLAPLAMATTRYLPTGLAHLTARLWALAGVWIYDDSPGAENVIEYALWTGPRTVSAVLTTRRVQLLRQLDLRRDLRSIRVPALVLDGPRDSYTPSAWSLEIARLIPDARYEALPGTGHCAHLSMPGAFNRLLLEWLDEVRPRSLVRADASAGWEDHETIRESEAGT